MGSVACETLLPLKAQVRLQSINVNHQPLPCRSKESDVLMPLQAVVWTEQEDDSNRAHCISVRKSSQSPSIPLNARVSSRKESIYALVVREQHESNHRSSAHSFSRRICSSSSGVKSFVMLNVFRISSGDFPLIMLATVLQPTSSKGLMSR